MKKILLITLLSLITISLFSAGHPQYNGTGYPSSLPSLAVELKSDGNTLGFGFSSTDPGSTYGITNISEMPLDLSTELDSSTGKIKLIGRTRTSFYIWWQIQMPIATDTTGYSFSVKKDGDLVNGTYTIPYNATITIGSVNKEIGTTFLGLDTYTSYSESSIYSNSFAVDVISSDASGVPYGALLSSTITLEVKTI